jgi:enamine deaminase RidA (YjgF/YER057c/UK114 family)/ribosomal protein S18 acetylase RimI-like enzyme
MPEFPLTSEPNATDEDVQFIREAIYEFNMSTLNDRNFNPLSIFVRDDTGEIVAGVIGGMWGGWLHITELWVRADLRKQGYGTRLLEAAENEARAKNCRGVYLETFTFQAPEFYRQHGYQRAGQINDFPSGQTHFMLWKSLEDNMITASAEKRLAALGIILPDASNPAAQYTNYVEVNGLLFVSGKGASSVDGVSPKGKLGREFTTQEGYNYARQAGIEVLAVLKATLGSLDKVKRVVKIQGLINATADFEEHHKVLDGCSQLMVEVFGEQGIHARSVLGANSLRGNLPIVIDSIFAI